MFENLHFASYKYGEHDLQRIGVWVKDPTLLDPDKPAEASAPTEDAPTPVKSGASPMSDCDNSSEKHADTSFSSPPEQPKEGMGEKSSAETPTSTGAAQWIIFIHGGAWRDPRITYESFVPSIKHLCRRDNALPIAGYASIDYRLSVHPSYPQDPENTPKTSLREARHPDHLDDVCSAIVFLMSKFRFGCNYVLVGHSCGASLAFQVLMRVLVSQEIIKNEQRDAAHARLYQSREPQERIRKRKRSVALDNGEQSGHGIHGEDGSFEDRVHDKQTAIGLVGCDWQEEQGQDKGMEEKGEDEKDQEGRQEQGHDDKVEEQAREEEGEPMDIVSEDGDPDWEDADSTETQRDMDAGPVGTSQRLITKDYFHLPISVVGIAGLYDFERYSERNGDVDTSFLAAAYGPHKPDWSHASPAQFDGRLCNWFSRRSTIIGSSRDDELIDEPETMSMVARLAKEGMIYFANRSLKGTHDFIWEDGSQVADLVGEALLRASNNP